MLVEGNDTGQVELGVVGPGAAIGPGPLGALAESGEAPAPVPLSPEGELRLLSGARPAAPAESEEGVASIEASDASCAPWPPGGAVALPD
ncbi:MAG TPA: hypothetical protein VH112_09890 [Acidimicrobiales bacterium]|nr:hypothetical protein [Acidimicrobiales bacterium]